MNIMKTCFYRIITLSSILAAVLFLGACSAISGRNTSQDTEKGSVGSNSIANDSSLVQTQDEEPAEPDSSIMRIYKEILQDEAAFFSTDAQKDIKFSQLSQAVSSDNSVAANVSQFTVLDLDGDESMELVLRLTVNGDEYYGFEILHYQDGVVYGYTRWYRALRDLKADGSFSFSGGAADTGYGFLQFDGASLTEIVKAESKSSYDSNNNFSIEYFVDGRSAAEGDYLSAMNAFRHKPDATWYDFTDDNLSEILQG